MISYFEGRSIIIRCNFEGRCIIIMFDCVTLKANEYHNVWFHIFKVDELSSCNFEGRWIRRSIILKAEASVLLRENWFVDFHLAAVSTNQEYSSQSLISSYFIGVIISIEHLELAGSDGRSLFGWLWHVGLTSWLQIICNQQRETSATKIKTFSNSQKYFLTNL